MDIVIGIKSVPDPETRLRASADGRSLDPDGVKFTINGTYDEATVEEALQLKEKNPGTTVRVVSAGPQRSEDALRNAMAMGADEAVHLEVPAGTPLDPLLIARLLAVAIKEIPHDLVMVGKQAGDDEAGQVGSALGEYLGLPSYGFVTEVKPDPSSHRLAMRRYIEGGEETFSGPFPAVISLLKGSADPRTPTLPNVLKSRKKPVKKVPWAELQSKVAALAGGASPSGQISAFQLPPPRSGAKMIEFQTPDEAAEKLLKALREEAKVL